MMELVAECRCVYWGTGWFVRCLSMFCPVHCMCFHFLLSWSTFIVQFFFFGSSFYNCSWWQICGISFFSHWIVFCSCHIFEENSKSVYTFILIVLMFFFFIIIHPLLFSPSFYFKLHPAIKCSPKVFTKLAYNGCGSFGSAQCKQPVGVRRLEAFHSKNTKTPPVSSWERERAVICKRR